jgi:hypothetical protein
MRFRCRLIAVAGLAWLLAAAGHGWASPAADDRFLAGLRQRRLYRLAENFCRQQLRRSGLSDRRRADLVIELTQTCADHARQATGPESQRLWQAALAASQEFIREEPTSPRLVLVQVQSATVRSSYAASLLTEHELGGPASLDQARGLVREAIAGLRAAEREVAEQLRRKRQGEVNGPGMLTAAELGSLARHVQFELAEALLNQGRTYPAGSADRVSALSQADEILSPLADRDQADELAWASRLARIALSRLSGDAEAMTRRMTQLEAAHPPAAILAQAWAERVGLDLDFGRVDEALKTASAHASGDARSPEWDYAVLAAYVAAWRKAGQGQHEKEAAAWQEKASKVAEAIERKFGPPWSRQAEMLLAGAAAGSAGTGATAVLMRAAETFYRAGRSDEALAAYDRAKAQAQHDQQPRVAFDAGFTAAAIEQQRKNYAEASRRFRALSLGFPQQDRAAQAHLLAAFDAAQLAGANDAKSVREYAAILTEQVEHWPQAPSTDQARLWLGKLHESRREWEPAIAAYRAIGAASPSYAEAVEAIGRCWPPWLDERQAAGGNTTDLARSAGEYFYGLAAPGGQVPQQWSPSQRAAALAAARVWLEHTGDHFAEAEQVLRSAMAADPAPDAQWQARASALLALAVAGQGRRREANELIARLPPAADSANTLLVVIEGLVRLAGSAADPAKRELGELALAACENLIGRAGGLSDRERKSVGLARASALTATGRTADAREYLASLARDFPRDQRIQQQYAAALADSQDAAHLHAALDRWRLLEQANRPGGDAWFRAKYGLALTHWKLGNCERAARLIELTQVLHPTLGGPQLKTKFLELLERCRQQSPAGETSHAK